jgi:uncharacterized DUF497 family protein
MRFKWDAAKDQRNRGFGLGFAALIFEGDTIQWRDSRRDDNEARVRTTGETDGIVLHVVFTVWGDVRRIISARLADRKERHQWHIHQ